MRRLVVLVLILLVVFIGADRGGEFLAERTAAQTLQTSQNLSRTPQVSIAGFPFLTQFVRGHYDRITVNARDVESGSGAVALRFSTLRVVLSSLTVSRDFSDFHADTASADASVSYRDLGRVLHLTLGYAGGGRIRATTAVTILGNTITAGVTTRPSLVDGALGFGATVIEGLGQAPRQVLDTLRSVFDARVALRKLPFQVSATSLVASPAGLRLSLVGTDVSYSR